MGKPKILIVEDEAIIAMDIEEALFSLHYDVVGKASSGEEALDLVRATTPSLVLMDINLSGELDGISTVQQIREIADVPVVFLTALADRPTLDRAKVLEPFGYVLKPFRQTELRTAIELALHRHATEKQRRVEQASMEKVAAKEPEAVDFRNLVHLNSPPSASMQVTIRSVLEQIPPFSDLSMDLRSAISGVSYVQQYQAGDVVAREGAEAKAGFIVMSGRVGVYKTSPGGKELIVELLIPNDLFGIVTALEKGPLTFSARVQCDSRLLWIPREVIEYIADHYSQVTKGLFRSVLDRLEKAHDLSRALAHDRVEVRVASALLSMVSEVNAANKKISELEMTRQELGELVGATPETISRVLNRFESDGFVDLSHTGKVRVIDNTRLMQKVK